MDEVLGQMSKETGLSGMAEYVRQESGQATGPREAIG